MVAMDQKDNAFSAIVKPTVAVLLCSVVAVGISLPIYYAIARGGLFQWSLLKFTLGSVYGMLLGVGNFFAMALSMTLLTASAASAKEGKARAQSSYLLRQFFVVALAVVGCLIPFFHIVAVLGSLAVTQLVIVLYSLIDSLIAMKKNPSAFNGMKKNAPTESDAAENGPNETKDEN